MPRNKDLKRLVRTRMEKTGEAYTAARANILRKPAKTTQTKAPSKPDFAKLAGYSDETIKEKTGCTWERWVYALDRRKADAMTHGEVARLVHEKYKVDGWWAQAVTVGYERIKGKRVIGQRLDGTYEANKSRTYNVPVDVLFDAWAEAKTRRKWLDAEGVRLRTATPHKSVRLGWTDGGIVAAGFMDKGKSKSAVALQHTKLADRAAAERLKQYWSEQLDALGELLASR
jgi:hypothetical protein